MLFPSEMCCPPSSFLLLSFLPGGQEAAEIEAWWSTDRYAEIKRPYSALDVVSLRGSIKESFAADEMSKKLWDTLVMCKATGQHSRTFGALDVIQAVTMAPKLSSIYVSGWQSSSTASTSNEPGPDFADYPMDTVPNKVDQLFRGLKHHDRRVWEEAVRKGTTHEPRPDFLTPIVADADTGHGGLTAVMKLTKMFIEAGAAGCVQSHPFRLLLILSLRAWLLCLFFARPWHPTPINLTPSPPPPTPLSLRSSLLRLPPLP
jgi:isocitrate lyase